MAAHVRRGLGRLLVRNDVPRLSLPIYHLLLDWYSRHGGGRFAGEEPIRIGCGEVGGLIARAGTPSIVCGTEEMHTVLPRPVAVQSRSKKKRPPRVWFVRPLRSGAAVADCRSRVLFLIDMVLQLLALLRASTRPPDPSV